MVGENEMNVVEYICSSFLVQQVLCVGQEGMEEDRKEGVCGGGGRGVGRGGKGADRRGRRRVGVIIHVIQHAYT